MFVSSMNPSEPPKSESTHKAYCWRNRSIVYRGSSATVNLVHFITNKILLTTELGYHNPLIERLRLVTPGQAWGHNKNIVIVSGTPLQ